MSKLTGREIIRQIELGNITIDPFDEANVGPNSVNVRLGDDFVILDEVTLDLRKQPKLRRFPSVKQFVLPRHEVVLGHTQEIIGSRCFVPIIDGRSTIGRYGVAVHVCAGFGDVGFFGRWTLELAAHHRDTIVRPGDLIAQVSFETIVGEITPYTGSYANCAGPRGPRPLK